MTGNQHFRDPPRWAIQFLHWYCKSDLIEEIEGDLYELFDRQVEQGNPRLADWGFIWNVIRFFRFSNIKNTRINRSNSTIMFRNYIKIGFRSMIKNWSISLINILGLSFAIGTLITIFIFIDLQYAMDQFHVKKDDIYQVITKVKAENGEEQWADSPYPLGEFINQDVAQVEDFFRIEYRGANVRYGDNVFRETVIFTDPGYLDHLTFPISQGNTKALYSADEVVLSSVIAKKYFGDVDPIGQQIYFKFDGDVAKTFQVGAVLKDYPLNNSFEYGILLPISQFEALQLSDDYDWKFMTDATFVVAKEGTDPATILELLTPYKNAFNATSSNTTITGFRLLPLSQLSLNGFEIIGAIANFSNPTARLALGIIVVLLVILASFNYMNIAVAAATKRLKEIGMRKVMGGQKRQIVHQFLVENTLQVSLSIVLGLALCYVLLLPGFNMLIPVTIPFNFSSMTSMIGLFAGLLLFVGFISGAYPSFYISRFAPMDIFRGKERFGSKNMFSTILLGFQFFIAFFTIVGCFMFTDNAIHQWNKEAGYSMEGMLSIRTNSSEEFQKIRDVAMGMPEVLAISSGEHHAGRGYTSGMARQLEKEVRANIIRVNPNYPSTINIHLKDGSYFSEDLDRTNQHEMLVDSYFASKMGWDDPIGQKVFVGDRDYNVVGVLDDYIIEEWAAYGERTPIVMTVSDESEDRYLILKTNQKDMYAFNDRLKQEWQNVAPYEPYSGIIQANTFDNFYRESKANVTIIGFISVISIILACLGLFGLLSFNIQKRLKEFSVRKVLGASAMSIVKLVSRRYTWVVVISFTFGASAGYFLMLAMIDSIYSDPKTEYFLPIFLAIVIMVVTITATITGQIIRATRVNPVKNLRTE